MNGSHAKYSSRPVSDMQHVRSLSSVQLNGAWLTIGAFDGVHLGHQAIIQQLTAGAHAAGAPAVVITFHPHPLRVLRGGSGPWYLTTPEQRAELLGDLGVDWVITHPFDQSVASLPGREFLARIHAHLGISQLWVGYDFAMGHGRDTDVDTLGALSQELGFTLQVAQAVKLDEGVVSSRRIRALLAEGDVAGAARLLDRPYTVEGTVIPGDGRGRQIGVPTANLQVWEEQALPGAGVYACYAEVEGQVYAAASNVGVRPTFDGSSARIHVEAHLLDYEGDLYGRQVTLAFVDRLRGEQRFSGIEALVNQIRLDIETTRGLLEA
jgi:riboflavin kinase / FMN adenylyltransferase